MEKPAMRREVRMAVKERGAAATRSQDTRLLYVTTGVLKRMIIGKKHLNDWTHIILDEVHEREEDMDLLLILCKKFLFTNSRNTKVMSNVTPVCTRS